MADLPFVDFAFPATDATASRTMPDRLAEIKNVMDFGAYNDGTHATETRDAIQAAVDSESGANRGTIYFPLGRYSVNSSITFNYDGDLSIRFLGEPGAVLLADVAGWVFDRHLATPNNTAGGRIFEKLEIQNSNATGGCIRIGSSIGVAIRDCKFQGFINITTEDAVGESSQNVFIENCNFSWNGAGSYANAHHIIIGGGGAIQGCSITGTGTAVRAYGSGLHCSGNRTERNATAWLLGLDSGGNNVGLSGFSLMAGSCEGNWTAIDFAGTCTGFLVGSYGIMGHDDSNAGPVNGIQDTQYGIRVRADCAQAGIIDGLLIGSNAEIAAFDIANATSRTNLVIQNVISAQSGSAGVAWNLPTNAYTARFSDCNTYPIWTYAQLPTGGDVLEGDEFDISNSNTATWGATAAGGGSNHVRVRYNGSVYTIVGK